MNEQVLAESTPEAHSRSSKGLEQEALYQYVDQLAVKVEEEKTALRGVSLKAIFADDQELEVAELLERRNLTVAEGMARDEAVARAARQRKNQLELLEEKKTLIPHAVRQLTSDLHQASRSHKENEDLACLAKLLPPGDSQTNPGIKAEITAKWLAVKGKKINPFSNNTDRQEYCTAYLQLYEALGSLLEQYYDNVELKRPAKVNWLLTSSKAVTRRRFLAGAGVAVAAVVVAPHIPRAIVAGQAAEARPALNIANGENINPMDIEGVYLEVKPLYEEFFSECRNLIAPEKWGTIGRRMILFAHMYYLANKESGSFKKYYLDFMHQAFKFSQDIGLHPVVTFRTLAESVGKIGMGGFATWTQNYNLDRQISQGQAMGKMVMMESPAAGQAIANLLVSSGDSFQARLAKSLSDKLPMQYGDLVRFFGPITMGINDMEVELVANGIARMPTDKQREFKDQYPEAYRSFSLLREQRRQVEAARSELKQACGDFVRESKLMKIFFEQPTARHALAQIGIDEDNLDEQLLRKPTACWRSVIELPPENNSDRNKAVVNGTLKYYQQKYEDKGDEAAAMTLMSQQLTANEGLMSWLEKNCPTETMAQVHKIKLTREKFLSAVKQMGLSELAADRDVGRREFDVDFQLKTGISAFKYLADEAIAEFGQPNEQSPDSLSFHNFALLVNREIVNSDLFIDGSIFARNEIIDPVYDSKATLRGLRLLIEKMKEIGFIDKNPWEEGGYGQFWQAIEDIELLGYTNKNYGPDLEAKIEKIYKYFHQWQPGDLILWITACSFKNKGN